MSNGLADRYIFTKDEKDGVSAFETVTDTLPEATKFICHGMVHVGLVVGS
jgi:hypothetical protein